VVDGAGVLGVDAGVDAAAGVAAPASDVDVDVVLGVVVVLGAEPRLSFL
jgi:hypothetical protein